MTNKGSPKLQEGSGIPPKVSRTHSSNQQVGICKLLPVYDEDKKVCDVLRVGCETMKAKSAGKHPFKL